MTSLLLDEHFSPLLAVALRERGYDVTAVWEDPELRGLPDAALFAHAVGTGQRIVTENVRDFLPLAASARSDETPAAALLLVSPNRFSRESRSIGALVVALAAWLDASDGRPDEDWFS